jgi:carbonic anhydrase
MQQQNLLYKSRVDPSTSLLLKRQSSTVPIDRSPTTIAPSPSPSVHPTNAPTTTPTIFPSKSPISSPSSSPTVAPTIDPYKDHIPPENPDPWYFNYDDETRVGLVRSGNGLFEVAAETDPWGSVSSPPNDYWNEFTDNGFGTWKHILQIYHPLTNRCATGQRQSPIDVRENGAICHERHQIRSRSGNTEGENIQKKIESNKLRLTYERRPCSNITLRECQHPDPPHADFPHGWGGFADILHIDIKVKSEHKLLNEQFDAEMQINHLHPGRRRIAAISVLIRATSTGYNYYFDEAIKAFRVEYNRNIAKCRRRLKHIRVLSRDYINTFPNYVDWAKNTTGLNNRYSNDNENIKMYDDKVWNPYHEMLIPTIYFYRYEGSLTEPPCGEFVSWWIADTPMIISFDQLEQLKTILFTNVDENCKTTGVQHDRSVARAIQDTNNRPIWRCTSSEFGPDP